MHTLNIDLIQQVFRKLTLRLTIGFYFIPFDFFSTQLSLHDIPVILNLHRCQNTVQPKNKKEIVTTRWGASYPSSIG